LYFWGLEEPMEKIKVLLVDDSAIVREVLTSELGRDPQINIVGTAPDAFIARDKILKLAPDVVLLDIEMPRMDGLTFLRRLMHYKPLPVIIVSSLTEPGGQMALDAIRAGAVDVACKPGPGLPLADMTEILLAKIKAAFQIKPETLSSSDLDVPDALPTLSFEGPSRRIVAMGASTGGTQALEHILGRFPADAPPTLIVQHMPAYFTASFAKRLDSLCAMEVREAADGDVVRQGLALIAPGNRHMLLRRRESSLVVQIKDGPMVYHQRPSVEVLFQSVAKCKDVRVAAALLTGMGSDGAEGLLALRQQGAYTLAQDRASCVVFGMPAEAIKLGAAVEIAPLRRIPELLLQHASEA